jgi:hypothetical protein
MTISEPATLITDYLLALLTGALAYRLWHAARAADEANHKETGRLRRWWVAAFAATAVAGAAGGTVHGFQHVLAPRASGLVWLLTLESLIAAGFAVVGAAILFAGLSASMSARAIALAAALFVGYGLWVVSNPLFLWAIVAYAAAFVVLIALRLRAGPLDAGGRLLVAGVGVSIVAAVIQQSGWSLHRYFNHNDLYHVVQAVAIWLLYRAAMTRDIDVTLSA